MPIPPVQRHGGAVLFSGPAVRELETVLRRALPMLARADSVPVPTRWRAIVELLNQAALELPVAEIRREARSPSLTVWEVAELLGVGERQVRNLAQQLGGRKIRREWLFDRDVVEAEAARRKESAA